MPRKPETVSRVQARRLLLAAQALLEPATESLEALVHRLGYLQLDSINVVERAHHLTLGSRVDGYRPEAFDALLDGDRKLFEHWTHDASAVPLCFYPYWRLRFPRSRERLLQSAWWRERVGDKVDELLDLVRGRIRAEGPLRSADFEHPREPGAAAWWGWKPQKAALEFLWHTGELAVARRVHFHKVYDLAERVLPAHHGAALPTPEAHLAWACWTALERLAIATPRELAAFWNAIDPPEAAAWCAEAAQAGRIRQVLVEGAEGEAPRPAYALPDWKRRAAALPEPGGRMVLLSPFDPILRDRTRALRLFDFDYRFEAFVPEDKRQYGYYVLPILQGDALVGRVDPKFHRAQGVLEVKGVWWEQGVRSTKARKRLLEAACQRLAAQLGARGIQLP